MRASQCLDELKCACNSEQGKAGSGTTKLLSWRGSKDMAQRQTICRSGLLCYYAHVTCANAGASGQRIGAASVQKVQPGPPNPANGNDVQLIENPGPGHYRPGWSRIRNVLLEIWG